MGIIRVVVEGGPCAGKSTSLVRLFEKSIEAGLPTLCCWEQATRFILAGVNPESLRAIGSDAYLAFQRTLLRAQLTTEDWLTDLFFVSRTESPKVLICDRGALSGGAYCSETEFGGLLAELGLNRPELLARYVWVGHLVTAADGAEPFYTLANNEARRESPAEARELDKRTQRAWLGHPNLTVIDNSTGFEDKIRRLIATFERAVGIPVSTQLERKFVLATTEKIGKLPPFEEFAIDQAWLPHFGEKEDRIRRRLYGKTAFYTRTLKSQTRDPLTRIRREKTISRGEYERLLAYQICPELGQMRKRRLCFFHDNQYFRLDVFLAPEHLIGLTILEIEPTERNEKVRMPRFIGPVAEVTGDARYMNRMLYESRPPNLKHRNGWRFPWQN